MTAYDYLAEEARDARQAAERSGEYSPCYRHRHVADGYGGGVCTGCGDTVRHIHPGLQGEKL